MKKFFPLWLTLHLILPIFATAATSGDSPGLLPIWVDQSQTPNVWLELPFPPISGTLVEIPASCRFLIIQLKSHDLGDDRQTAFALKNLIIEARTQAPGIEVAIEGAPETVARVSSYGLAPYIDAYIDLEGSAELTGDKAARIWSRIPASEDNVLDQLLAAAAQGVKLVVLDGLSLSSEQKSLLELIGGLSAFKVETQPLVSGIAQEQVLFFLDPETGHHFLTARIAGTEPQHLHFDLGPRLEAHKLYPQAADYELKIDGQVAELSLSGSHRFYLFELSSSTSAPSHSSVIVEGSPFRDPYEIVVLNQVFRQKEATKVQSLDATEVVRTLGQRPGARSVRRQYRAIERQGLPTEYVWTGLAINGVDFPENKLRQGFIFDTDQVLLDPLSIELDRTYEYVYLGEEDFAGHPTWKIGFEPVRSGAFLSGTVWIDQKTHAHRRLEARHSEPKTPVASREFLVTYQWVEDRGQRYWTWTRNEGTAVLSYLGLHQPIRVDIERVGHRFNRPDLDDELAAIHQSDQKILRQTPAGMRWLSRPKPQRGRDRERQDDSQIRTAAQGRILSTDNESVVKSHRVGAGIAWDPEIGEPSTRFTPVYSYFSLALWGTKYQGYFNAGNGLAGIARPDTFRRGWTLSLDIDRPDSFHDRVPGVGLEEDLDFERLGLTLSLAMPVNSWLSVYARYRPSLLRFSSVGHADPAFVLPTDQVEQRGQLEVKVDRRGFSSELSVEYGRRDDWQPWGLDGLEPLEPSYFKLALRGGYSRYLTRNQSLGLHASYLRGSGLDRFSRIRLGSEGIRVSGYSSLIRFDQGFGLSLNYSGHFFKLFPVHLRLDYAAIDPDRELGDSEYLLGAGVFTTLHGPWKTDLVLQLSRGLATSLPTFDEEAMSFSIFLSRRF